MIEGAAIDSRAVRGGEAFFAFAGAHTDGHRFVPDALARGAAAAYQVQEDVPAPPAGALIRVDDTFQALHDLARFARHADAGAACRDHRLGGEDDHQGAARRHPRLPFPDRVDAGQPEQPLRLPALAAQRARRHRVDGGRDGDVDAGRAAPALAARPAGRRRLHRRAPRSPGVLRHVQAIAEAKSELLAGLDAGGFIVANADDPEVTRIAAARHGARVVWYGLGSDAEVRARDLAPEPDGGVGSRFRSGGRRSVRRDPPPPSRSLQRRELPGRGGRRLGARPLARGDRGGGARRQARLHARRRPSRAWAGSY